MFHKQILFGSVFGDHCSHETITLYQMTKICSMNLKLFAENAVYEHQIVADWDIKSVTDSV